MPKWRTFSSDGSEDRAAAVPPNTPAGASAGGHPRWLQPVLVGLGGLLVGGALVLLLSIFMTLGAATPLDLIGEPLDPLDASGDTTASGAGFETSREPWPEELVVDVAGAVLKPGLHRMRPGDRVGDAIAAAGGFGPRTDLDEASRSLNLAQPLQDGVKVLVPELGVDGTMARQGRGSDGRIDLNHASQSELESLPGIGPVTAGKIIEAREEARFATVRDVRTRGVVGQAVFDDIEGLVQVSP